MNKMPIHVEVWICSRILSQRNSIFTKHELMNEIDSVFKDNRHGISTHISSVCVANKKANHPTSYNYLISVSRGAYRVCRDGDPIHPSKIGYKRHPKIDALPEEYRFLLIADQNGQNGEGRVNLKPPYEVAADRSINQEREERIDILELQKYEKEAIARTILMMAFNPSCARIFTEQINPRIKKEIYTIIGKLEDAKSQDSFDSIHKQVLEKIVKGIENPKAIKRSCKITYGQAQKGLNVFLKVYVDWANLPNREIAGTVRPLLHCPLDSILMKEIKERERKIYKKSGSPPCDMKSIVTYDQYISWQKIIDEIIMDMPNKKRTIVDVLWYLKSLKKKQQSE